MSDKGSAFIAPGEKTVNFLDLGRLGKSAWWRYLLGALIIGAGYFVFGVLGLVMVIMVASGGHMPKIDHATGQFAGVDQMANYVAVNIPDLVLLVFTVLVVWLLLGRPVLSLITARKFSWKRLAVGFCAWVALALIASFCSFVCAPRAFQFVPPGREYFLYLPLIFVLTPIQCLSEELFFRGYLLQGFGKWVRNIWLAAALNGFLFMLPHVFNPEVAYGLLPMCLVYFLMGFLLALFTLRSNSMEMAIGAHMANNLFDAVILNDVRSALTTRSLFVCTKGNPWFDVCELVVFGALLYWLLGQYLAKEERKS